MDEKPNTWRRAAATSVPGPKAPDAQHLRRRSEDPTLGDGSKPPTTLGWAPTPTLEDRRVLDAPAYVVLEEGADGPGTRVVEGLAALGRPVERIAAGSTEQLSPGPLNHPLVVHVASAGSAAGHPTGGLARTVGAYRGGATVTYDVALDDDASAGPGEELRRAVESLVAVSDLVKVSTRALGRLYAAEEATDVVRRWLTSGPGIVVVSAGADGAWASNAVGVTAKVTGADLDGGAAGDAFMAGIIDALWKGGLLGVTARPDLRTLVKGSLQELLDNAAAAASVARSQGRPPNRDELAAARGIPLLSARDV